MRLTSEKLETFAQGRDAVKAFRAMQGGLTGYARALTGDQKLRVEASSSHAYTEGRTIFIPPPIKLGQKMSHEPELCDVRGSDGLKACEACRVREEVLVNVYHEISHIVFGTFDSDKATMREMKAANEYFPHLFNALEDSRVDASMFEARPGTKKMMWADTYAMLNRAVLQEDGTERGFAELPLNAQVSVGVYLQATGYDDWSQFACEQIAKTFEDAELRHILGRAARARTVSEIGRLVPIVYKRLVDLGYYETQQDPTPEKEPEDVQEEEGPDPDPASGDSESDSNQGSPGEAEGEGRDGDDVGEQSDGFDSGGHSEDQGPQGRDSEDSDSEAEGPLDYSDDMGQAESSDQDSSDGSSGANSSDVGPDDASSGESNGSEQEPDANGDSDLDGSLGGSSEGDSDLSASESDSDKDRSSDQESNQDSGGGDRSLGRVPDEQPEEGPGPDGAESGPDGADAEPGTGDSESDGFDGERSGTGDPTQGDRDGNDDAGGAEGSPGAESGSDQRDAGDASGLSVQNGEDSTLSPSAGESNGEASLSEDPHVGSSSDGASDAGEPDNRIDSGVDDESEQQGPREEAEGEGVRDSEDGGTVSGERGNDEGSDRAESHAASDTEGDSEDTEPVESGAATGSGIKVDVVPEYGDVNDVVSSMEMLHPEIDHNETGQSRLEDDAVAVAVIQGQYFETPSFGVWQVQEFEYDPGAPGWNDMGMQDHARKRRGIDGDFDVPESVLGPALLKTRRIFSDNKLSGNQQNLRSGRVNSRVLGKRAWTKEDNRLFHKRTVPAKRDYAVLIMMDISSSNAGSNLALLKRSVMAQAHLCHRVGIQFSIVAHSCGVVRMDNDSENYGFGLNLHHIKHWRDPWDSRVENNLSSLNCIGGNLDGHALEFGRKSMQLVEATDKIILYYTDGKMPAANEEEELVVLQAQIKKCKAERVTLLGVGMGTDSPVQHGLDTVMVESDDDLSAVVTHLGKRLA